MVLFNFAGIIEGYLTRNSISEYYKEFFANGLCLENPDFCAYMQKQIDINEAWLGKMIKEKDEEEPYWHMISLFYSQASHEKELFCNFVQPKFSDGWHH